MKNYYEQLGAHYTPEKTDFSVWAPTTDQMSVHLYSTGSEEEEGASDLGSYEMEKKEDGIFTCAIKGDLHGVYYVYECTRGNEVITTTDIYGKACGVNGERSMVVDLSRTNPYSWNLDHRVEVEPSQTVIYEVHIRDFSEDKESGVQESFRGKYLAFTQKHTSLNKDGLHPTCLSYLKKLGVTHVHLLPFFDYGSVDERHPEYNWGYDPVHYMIPEGAYATDPYKGEVRIKETKEMIQSLHEEGIGVIMDVVFNHTYAREDSPFNKTVPDYYYRFFGEKASDGSMCGNDTASEKEMFRAYMVEAVTYWAKEYHLDGFRFDLMGLHDVETMNQIREALNELPDGEKILVYGEPWKAAKTALAPGNHLADKEHLKELAPGIKVFCDNTRDAIKGSVFEAEETGYVSGEVSLYKDIAAAVEGWKEGAKGFHPTGAQQLVNYVSAHDNFTLWDKLVLSARSHAKQPDFFKRDEEIIQMNKMCAGIYFTLPGTPFLQAGEEGARTKDGDENSYKSPIEVNEISWRRIWEYENLVEYYRFLINLRKRFSFEETKLLSADKEMITFEVTTGETFVKKLFICYYPGKSERMLELPEGEWIPILDGRQFWEENNEGKKSGSILLRPKSVSIFGRI